MKSAPLNIKLELPSGRGQIALLVFLSAVITTAMFLVQGKIGFSLSDEGYLWYGAQRVLKGEVPIRDFMAYDPGRYYWSAVIMGLKGSNGIVALRIAEFAFQGIGLLLGLVIVARSWKKPDVPSILLAAAIITLWMFLQYKSFDLTASIALVAALAYLVERPSARRYFLAGVVIGLVAILGRNHGIYGLIGGLGVIGYLILCNRAGGTFYSILIWWIAGVFVGYIPMLLALALVPGWAAAFWDGIRFLFEIKSTNISPPIPWPSLKPIVGLLPFTVSNPTAVVLIGNVVGLFFIALPTFGVAGIAYAVYARFKNETVPPVVVASVFLALPYAHYTFSRADVEHLSFGIFPFLLGVLAIFSGRPVKIRIMAISLLLVASLAATWPFQPKVMASCGKWKKFQVGRDTIRIDPDTAYRLIILRTLMNKYCADEGTFLVAPFWPAFYAVFERKSPTWEIFAAFPRSEAFQQTEIKRISEAAPKFVVINDYALDSRDDLRFENTHPSICRYIRQNFEPVEESLEAIQLYVYRSKPVAP
ncbi:MAG: hypothetical protein ACLQBD_20565 [Syntrophobacteraceae bacterium]